MHVHVCVCAYARAPTCGTGLRPVSIHVCHSAHLSFSVCAHLSLSVYLQIAQPPCSANPLWVPCAPVMAVWSFSMHMAPCTALCTRACKAGRAHSNVSHVFSVCLMCVCVCRRLRLEAQRLYLQLQKRQRSEAHACGRGQLRRCAACRLGAWACRLGVWACRLGAWACRLGAWACRLGVWACRLGAWARLTGASLQALQTMALPSPCMTIYLVRSAFSRPFLAPKRQLSYAQNCQRSPQTAATVQLCGLKACFSMSHFHMFTRSPPSVQAHMHVHTNAHTHTCTQLHARAHTHKYRHTNTHTRAHAHAHKRTRAHTCTRTRTRTHVHPPTHTHTRVQWRRPPLRPKLQPQAMRRRCPLRPLPRPRHLWLQCHPPGRPPLLSLHLHRQVQLTMQTAAACLPWRCLDRLGRSARHRSHSVGSAALALRALAAARLPPASSRTRRARSACCKHTLFAYAGAQACHSSRCVCLGLCMSRCAGLGLCMSRCAGLTLAPLGAVIQSAWMLHMLATFNILACPTCLTCLACS